jgi:hypothetical protein
LIADLFFIEDTVKLPFMKLPNRCTIVKLSDSQLIVISPTHNFADYKSKIDSFGKVVAIVEPNMFHHLFSHKARKLYPHVPFYAVEGLKKKCPHIAWDQTLDPKTWPWQSELEAIPIEGMPNVQEHVFLFKKEKTLIVTDLYFNLQEISGWGPWLILSLFGTWKKFGMSKLFLKYVTDKKKFWNSIETLTNLNFEHLVMAHGTPLFNNGRTRVREHFLLGQRGG